MSETAFGETQVADPYVGTVVQGKYRFIRKLGEGGMGAVYRAEQTSLKRVVALKVLRPEVANSPLLVRRFTAEHRAADRPDEARETDHRFRLPAEFREILQ